uniref:Uncharacterized protein n=1 Tax=viral metagenome TaxID=1070528 RepID=A0A6C0AEX9_9ZZZZ
MKFKEAYNFLIKINPKICPNEGFIKQLEKY